MKTNTNQVVDTTKQPFNKDVFLKEQGTKSQAIRTLNLQGFERKDIAKMLGIRYQHVRNVLITPIKKVSSGRVGGMEDLTS
jgi:hypothetical protein